MAHRNTWRRQLVSSVNVAAPARISRFRVALNDSAIALSALVPTAPMDWVTPSWPHSLAYDFEV